MLPARCLSNQQARSPKGQLRPYRPCLVASEGQGLLITCKGNLKLGGPESVKTVLEDKAYGHVVTFNPNGRPQVTMVWMDVEGNEALFNTAEGRKKA